MCEKSNDVYIKSKIVLNLVSFKVEEESHKSKEINNRIQFMANRS